MENPLCFFGEMPLGFHQKANRLFGYFYQVILSISHLLRRDFCGAAGL
ncbi:hypothetical protein [Vibrio penaeicida]|nr:hypothetical protein [Vibrio penaeicida]